MIHLMARWVYFLCKRLKYIYICEDVDRIIVGEERVSRGAYSFQRINIETALLREIRVFHSGLFQFPETFSETKYVLTCSNDA